MTETTMMNTDNVTAFPCIEPLAEGDTRGTMTLIIRVRRNIRHLLIRIERLRDRKQQAEQSAEALRLTGTAFDHSRIARYDALAGALGERISEQRDLLHRWGDLLIDAAPFFDRCLTLAQRCDLLNINQADRGRLTDDDGLISLTCGHSLEDSAANRKTTWNNGPLFAAMWIPLFRRMKETTECREVMDSIFEPGGLFEGAPMYRQAADGSMVRMPPRLRVVKP
jgi:hypothetical protein